MSQIIKEKVYFKFIVILRIFIENQQIITPQRKLKLICGGYKL